MKVKLAGPAERIKKIKNVLLHIILVGKLEKAAWWTSVIR
jgi:hypothetical protein